MFTKLFLYQIGFATVVGILSVATHSIAGMHRAREIAYNDALDVYASANALAWILTVTTVLLIAKFCVFDLITEYRTENAQHVFECCGSTKGCATDGWLQEQQEADAAKGRVWLVDEPVENPRKSILDDI
jgi:hypothetical protein